MYLIIPSLPQASYACVNLTLTQKLLHRVACGALRVFRLAEDGHFERLQATRPERAAWQDDKELFWVGGWVRLARQFEPYPKET